jgi:predicted dehydrogenase
MKRVRAGFVGAGFVGPIHMENLRRLGYVDVIALAESNQDLADEAAKNLGIPYAYGKWEELVNSPDIDVVHITCPNSLHYPVAKACFEAGKAVVCDKPLTLDMNEALTLVKLAKETKMLNAITFNMGFYPLIQEAKAMIHKGEAGKLNLVYGRYVQDWLTYPTDYNWRVEAKYGGKSRSISDIGSHWIQMVQMLTKQRVVSVYGDSSIFVPVRKKPKIAQATFPTPGAEIKESDYEDITVDTEDHATIMFKFEDGLKGVLVCCQANPGRKQRIEWEIVGSEKSLSWNGEEPNVLWIGSRKEANKNLFKDPSLMSPEASIYSGYPQGLQEGYPDSWKNIMMEIYKFYLNDGVNKGIQPNFPTFKEGYKIMIIIDSILESIEKNQWVDIDWDSFDNL